MTTKPIDEGRVYILRDTRGHARRIFRAYDEYHAERKRPGGWSLEMVYSSQIPAEVAVMQRAIGRWLSLPGAQASGNWPVYVALPTRDEMYAAEATLGVDAGLPKRSWRRQLRT